MNNGMLMLVLGLGLLWMFSRNQGAPRIDSITGNPWIAGSQMGQETIAYDVGF
mgnify:FL=1